MMRTRFRLISGLVLAAAVASCSSSQPEVEVRAAASAGISLGVGEAEGHLALGNVGIALEGFRKALREQPGNVRALVGIAHSYERMGRFDLTGKWFERALAASPADPIVLNEFAASLDRQGLALEAASLRAEAAVRSASPSPPKAAAPLVLSEAVNLAAPLDLAAVESAASVTVALPPPQKANRPETPADAGQPAVQSARAPRSSGPRLERLSLGEVALITRPRPLWNAQLVERSPRSVTYRFVALQPAPRLLNAARLEGLAARTRAHLAERGWKRLDIGDAPAVRDESVVLYPQSQRAMAKRLASQLGFAELRRFNGSAIVVLLGRDAARLKGLHPA